MRHRSGKNHAPIPIEFPSIHEYSIGESPEGRPLLWVQGRCGAWYEVKPSTAYTPTYKMMLEGISLYYQIVDFYGAPKDRIQVPGKRDEVSRLFLQVSY